VSGALGVLPYALAAGGGRVDDHPAAALVAAGLALLRGQAPLVRALAGRRSAILCPPSPAFVVALAASEGRGAVLINPLAAPLEIAMQCLEAEVGVVFTVAALAARVPAHLPVVLLDDVPRVAIVRLGEREVSVPLALRDGLRLDDATDADGRDEEAAIVYTSGMAGRPLGSIATHRNLLHNARAVRDAAGLTPLDHTLAVLPFAHLFGLTVTLAAPLLAGGRVSTMARFAPARAIERLEADDITVIAGVPAVYLAILGALAKRGGPLRPRALRRCIVGGAALPASLQAAWTQATGVELHQGYGLTEASPVCLFNPVDRPNRHGVLGVPFASTAVSVREPFAHRPDADALAAPLTPEVPDGTVGELCVRGDHVSPGYLQHGRQGLPRPDGWLYSGDLVCREPDGALTFRGLVKAMFTRNGFNIYPRELEAALLEHPRIETARVTGVPHPTHEHDIVVELDGPADDAEVRAWCEVRLAAYKQPTLIRRRSV
jgi:long-chain acyl-CoA synthetase